MSANIYFLNLLFIYGVLCQGIVGTVSEKDIGESSDLLVREKRVISRVEGEDVRQSIKDIPYIVFIRERRTENHCSGSILTNNIVITASKCVSLAIDSYNVFSATSRAEYSRRSNIHRIVDKRSYNGPHPFRSADGVALIAVYPSFLFGGATQSIPFFDGQLHPGTIVTVSGWGCDESRGFETQHPSHLRSIFVPIISNEECANLYHRVFAIGEADICTLDPNLQRYCTVKDAGAPLVVISHNAHFLIGIHLWNGGVAGRPNPDVYVNLQNHFYKIWLAENIRSMEFLHG